MRKVLMFAGSLLFIAGAVGLYNLDAITGQKKFEKLCEAEGGLKIMAQIERNVGWEVEGSDAHDYQVPFSFGNVAFVRYADKQGLRFDTRRKGGTSSEGNELVLTPADLALSVRYRFSIQQSLLPEDGRFSRTRYVITDVASGKVVATHTSFNYQWTKPERVMLNAPTSVSCHAGKDIDSFFLSIYNTGSEQ